MACKRCEDLCVEYRVASPDDLRRTIRRADRGIADGILRLAFPANTASSGTPFHEVANGGSWDDIVSYYFQCIHCDQFFRLGAETYHGSGGSWQAVPAT